jgi:DNA-binding transcriptional LysR family regulator
MDLDWDKLRIFHAVAEAGSFTHAAEGLALSQSAVSRHVGSLETSLGTVLFRRHARGVLLTEQGEALFRTAAEVAAKIAQAEALASSDKDSPSGELRVTTTVAFGSTWLTQRIREFLEMYPDIFIELLMEDGEIDLSMRQADCAIRLYRPHQPGLIARKLTRVQYSVYAALNYLDRKGEPMSAENLDLHDLVIYGANAPTMLADVNWLMFAGANPAHPRKARAKINNIYGVLKAVESGLGIGSLPDYMVGAETNLVRILTNVPSPIFEAYFTYPEELRGARKIDVFRDFLIAEVAKDNPKALPIRANGAI